MEHSRSLKPLVLGSHSHNRIDLSGPQTALQRIPLPGKVEKAIAEKWPAHSREYLTAIETWKRVQRNAMIYLDFTKAEDKITEAERLREYWGFQKASKIEEIVARVRFEGLPAEYCSEDYVIRDRKKLMILKDAENMRATINAYVQALQKFNPDDWIEVEMTEETWSGKGKAKTRARKIRVSALIVELFEKLIKLHQGETIALDPYVTPVPRRHEVNLKSTIEGKSDDQVTQYYEALKKRRDAILSGGGISDN